VEPEDALCARIDTELYQARKLLERGDADGARIAAWAARQLAERDGLPELADDCIVLIMKCDAVLGVGGIIDVRTPATAASGRR